jgi:hypothetical protein
MDDAQFFEALNLPINFRAMGESDRKRGFALRNGMPNSYYEGYQSQHEKSEKKENAK